eukprot:TRINITY_DN3937_c0_g1_i3.p2 TRINITY_DN3937_c0_g1~~TRINITY_DN3937_c0_g1_i3.p2  ORF type:complete len:112 (+),score=24.12 TRINITY_DN3937_c0_g1_i3:769-1104(+)
MQGSVVTEMLYGDLGKASVELRSKETNIITNGPLLETGDRTASFEYTFKAFISSFKRAVRRCTSKEDRSQPTSKQIIRVLRFAEDGDLIPAGCVFSLKNIIGVDLIQGKLI